MTLTEEMKEFIEDQIMEAVEFRLHEAIDQMCFDEKDNIRLFRKELVEEVKKVQGYWRRMDEIEHLINEHAKGVQRVYDEVAELKSFYKLATKGRSLENTIHEMKVMIEEVADLKEKFEWRLTHNKESLEKLNRVLEALD